MSEIPASLNVRFESNDFYLSTDSDSSALKISTPLSLDRSSEALQFTVIPLIQANLHENAIREVFMHGGERIGWLVPANALSSDEHDYAENPHFLKYAYVTVRDVLEQHSRIVAPEIGRLQAQGALEARFADLFHDNVCFLTLSMIRLPEGVSAPSLTPSIISEGYLPYGASVPDSVHWRPRSDQTTKKLKLRSIGPNIAQPDVPIRMMTVAAAGEPSPVIQFFYLYQVVEFLMEEVLRSSIAAIGSDIGKAIEADEFQTLRDQLEEFQTVMSEKRRLTAVMDRCDGSRAAISGVEEAARDFLRTVGVIPKEGIGALYQVRNFVVHRIRSMPHESEDPLKAVVYEFARFLPVILEKFDSDDAESDNLPAPGDAS